MTTITNHSSAAMTFPVKGGKKNEQKFETIAPGETKDIDLMDRKAPIVTAREHVGAITVNDTLGRKTVQENSETGRGE
jgi:hypothetical protein